MQGICYEVNSFQTVAKGTTCIIYNLDRLNCIEGQSLILSKSEKEYNKSVFFSQTLAKHSRLTVSGDGPPPFVPFGQGMQPGGENKGRSTENPKGWKMFS